MPLRVNHRRVNIRSCSFQEAVVHSRINSAELIQVLANNEATFAPRRNICDCFHANVVDADMSWFSGVFFFFFVLLSKTLHLVLIVRLYECRSGCCQEEINWVRYGTVLKKKRKKMQKRRNPRPHSKKKKKKTPGGLNEITPKKIELVWPTEGRNARN